MLVFGSSRLAHVLDRTERRGRQSTLSRANTFNRMIGEVQGAARGDLKLTISPMWGRDMVSRDSGAEAEADGPVHENVGRQRPSCRTMRVIGKIGRALVLDTGFDLVSRVTTTRRSRRSTTTLVRSAAAWTSRRR